MTTKGTNEEIDWDNILEKFSLYEGKIRDFCKENSINHHQLYYRRKRARKEKQQIFHAVTLDNQMPTSASHTHPKDAAKEIKIEIGKAKIYIPSTELELVSNIIKELQHHA